MRFSFTMYDQDDQREVSVSKDGIEFLDDLLELFLTFTRASGYTYVEGIGADKGKGDEVWTVR